jgi:hypothetical protein
MCNQGAITPSPAKCSHTIKHVTIGSLDFARVVARLMVAILNEAPWFSSRKFKFDEFAIVLNKLDMCINIYCLPTVNERQRYRREHTFCRVMPHSFSRGFGFIPLRDHSGRFGVAERFRQQTDGERLVSTVTLCSFTDNLASFDTHKYDRVVF